VTVRPGGADPKHSPSTSVAFFRNLNLGQRRSHSPTRAELLQAFTDAGAVAATSFQVNGTVIFEPGSADPQALTDEVVALLTPVCGYADVALARPVMWLRELDLEDLPRNAEVSFFDAPDPFPAPLPWVAPEKDGLTVVRADHRHAVSVDDLERTSGATWVLEALLGVPVTSRGVPTMRRLQAKLSSAGV
jgi:hypothetical protein